jgi:hypothetical protein
VIAVENDCPVLSELQAFESVVNVALLADVFTFGVPPLQEVELVVTVTVSDDAPPARVSGGLNLSVPVMSLQLYVPVPTVLGDAADAMVG